jgi:hypothetical protein
MPLPDDAPLLFLTIFTKQETSYFLDMHVAYLAGALRAQGIRADLAEAYQRRGHEAYNADLFERVRSFVATGGYARVVVSRAWDATVLEAIAGAPNRPEVVPFERFDQASALAAFGDVLDAEPVLDVTVLNADFRPPLPWLTLFGDDSCIWRRDVRTSAFLAGCPLPTDGSVSLRGCSFCRIRKDAPRRPVARIWPSVERQLRRLAALRPDARDYVLIDQAPFAYVGRIVRLLGELGLTGATLHLQSRVDVFLKNLGRFEDALALARPAGVRLSPYLVGIENFSDAELARLHKGVTAAENERFLAELDRLASAWAPALATEGWSFGFLLFTPWTTLGDLEVNLAAFRRVGMTRFRGDEILTKLRLTPDLPLTHKAAADGLLQEAWPHAFLSNAARWGYEAELPWRFADLAVQRVAELVFSEYEARKPVDQYAFFDLVLRFVKDQTEAWLRDAPHEARVEAFEAAHGAELAALQRAGRRGVQGGEGEAAREAARAVLRRLAGKLPLDAIEIGETFRLRLRGGLVLELAPRGSTRTWLTGERFGASYATAAGQRVDLPLIEKVCRALVARLDALPATERALVEAALENKP